MGHVLTFFQSGVKHMAANKADTATIGPKHQRLSVSRDDSAALAIRSKLVEGLNGQPMRGFDNLGNRLPIAPADYMAARVSNLTTQNVVDNKNMMQLLPDMELAKQVLVSSILAPNDMMSSELTFTADAPEIADLLGPLLTVPREYFETGYRIEDLLPKMLGEALFDCGSYPMVILPESAIDEAINSNERVSVESIRSDFDVAKGTVKFTGILGIPGTGTTDNTSMESLGLEAYSTAHAEDYDNLVAKDALKRLIGFEAVGVTDNPNALKMPMLRDKISQDRIQDTLALRSLSMEMHKPANAAQGQSDAATRASLFRPRNFKHVPVMQMKSLSQTARGTIGHPLVMTVPAECVIPVHAPGNPDEHIGYFLLLDRSGNPIVRATESNFYNDLTRNLNGSADNKSQFLALANRHQSGYQANANDVLSDEDAIRVYTEIIEADLMQRLRNGVYKDTVQISRPQDVYRIMLARACARQYTQLLYVPASLVVYIAFDYNQFGVGKSLLENTKILGTLRSLLTFADTMAAIKNSVTHRVLNIHLDPNSPDPSKDVEFLVHDFAEKCSAQFPLYKSHPQDQINYLTQAGTEVVVDGHPGYPETKVSVDEKSSSKVRVDTELSDSLRKRHLSAIGIAPETVDLSMNVDFATSVVSSNILLAKRAMMYQKKLCAFLSDFVQKYICNSSILMDRLRQVIADNADKVKAFDPEGKLTVDTIVLYFINSIRIELPEPDLSKIEQQFTAFENYNKLLEPVLDSFLSAEMFDSAAMPGSMSGAIPATKAVLKAKLQRDWLRKNNIMPEVFTAMGLDSVDGTGNTLLEQHEAYLADLTGALKTFMVKAVKKAAKVEAAITAANGGTPPDAATPAADDTGGGGGDDFGLDLGPGVDDATALPDVEAPAGDETPPADEAAAPAEGDATPPEDAEKPPKEEGTDKKPA
jgi:hypothetical protein